MTRRHLTAVALLGLVLTAALQTTVVADRAALTFGAPVPADEPDPRPNIVLITTDDQRAEEVWAMPNLRALLAARGTTFANSYSTFPLCCPARATFLTGQYAHNHGVLGNGTGTSPLGGFSALDTSSTIGTWLHDAGYQTAYVGKFLNGYGAVKPVRVPPGWDDWYASVGGGHYFDNRLIENGEPVQHTGPYQTDLYTDISIDIIERRIEGDDPLFLWTSYFAPHVGQPTEPDDPAITTPVPAPRHRDDFSGEPLRTDPSFDEADVTDKPAYVRNRKRVRPAMHGMLTELYQQRLESLQAVDEGIGRTIAALADAGELDNTVIVFTSDNGYMLGEHRIPTGKIVPYEPSTRVPLVARGPGFPSGVVRDQLAGNIDLAPTFAEVAGALPGLTVDGTSLLPLAANGGAGTTRDLLLEAGPRTLDGPMFYTAVRVPRWLYVEYPATGETELYNMARDPYQLRNLSGVPRLDGTREWLAEKLAQLRDCEGAGCR